MLRLLIVLQILVISVLAQAQEATFGPEFNFTNQKLIDEGRAAGPNVINTDANTESRKQLLNEIRKRCPDCRAKRVGDFLHPDYKIQSPQGWSFTLTLDPWVVEVIMDPLTVKEIEKYLPEIQRLIFDAAADAGLHSSPTSGHIHIGISTGFNRDPIKVRNFVVDWTNHSMAMAAAYGASLLNAAPMEKIKISESETVLDRFTNVVEEWDREYKETAKFMGSESMLVDFVETITNQVYVKSYEHSDPPEKYQNLNLSHIVGYDKGEQTVELRGVAEFKDARQYLEFAKVLQGRINYLSNLKIMIPVESTEQRLRRNNYQQFDEYMFQSGAHGEYQRLKSTFGILSVPIRISCEGMF